MKKQTQPFNFEESQAKLIEEIKPDKDLLGKERHHLSNAWRYRWKESWTLTCVSSGL